MAKVMKDDRESEGRRSGTSDERSNFGVGRQASPLTAQACCQTRPQPCKPEL